MKNIKIKINNEIDKLYDECDKNAEEFDKNINKIKQIMFGNIEDIKMPESDEQANLFGRKMEEELYSNTTLLSRYIKIIQGLFPKKWVICKLEEFFSNSLIKRTEYIMEFAEFRNNVFKDDNNDMIIENLVKTISESRHKLFSNSEYRVLIVNFICNLTTFLVTVQENVPYNLQIFKDSISEIKKYMDKNEIIPKHVIKNANGKNIINDLVDEKYKKEILKLVKEYNSILESKKITLIPKTEEKPKVKIQTREQRIAQYEKQKQLKTKNFYIDSEDTLTKEQNDAINEYVNMICSADEKESTCVLLELLPIEKFGDEKVLLNSVINKLKRKNINHLTNEVLIVLNNRLKDIASCKKKTSKLKK